MRKEAYHKHFLVIIRLDKARGTPRSCNCANDMVNTSGGIKERITAKHCAANGAMASLNVLSDSFRSVMYSSLMSMHLSNVATISEERCNTCSPRKIVSLYTWVVDLTSAGGLVAPHRIACQSSPA